MTTPSRQYRNLRARELSRRDAVVISWMRPPISPIAVALLLALSGTAFGQADPSQPSFEVASVKVSQPLPAGVVMLKMGGPGPRQPGHVDYKGSTLKALLAEAYSVKEYQVEGPAWIDSERYDINAKIPAGEHSNDEVKLMLRRLLAERFQITLHHESKSLPVYTLSVAKGGAKLTATDPKIVAEAEARRNAAGPPPPPPPPIPGGKLPAPAAGGMMMMFGPAARHLKGSLTMARLCEVLSNFQDRPVVDLTGLTGPYDLDLNWVPEDTERGAGKMGAAMIGAGMAPPSTEGKVPTAVCTDVRSIASVSMSVTN